MSAMAMLQQLSSGRAVLGAKGFKLLLHLPVRFFPSKSLLTG
jgi:hypothetical protein